MYDPKRKPEFTDETNPIYEPESGCEYLRTWEEGDFKLIIWDTNRKHHEGAPQWAIAYEFYHKGKLIFQAADFGCSPMHAVDSDKCVGGILTFLSLRPGDTDKEYFKDYTPEQMEFAVSHGEELGMYAMELEEKEEE
jgi:hypothetical protein